MNSKVHLVVEEGMLVSFCREMEPISIFKEIYCKELAHTITEAEKSHDLLCASWRPRQASDVVLVGVQRPESQENPWYQRKQILPLAF